MARPTKSITFSVPHDMAVRVDELMVRQRRSRSDLLRDAVLSYVEECEWRQVLRYGEQRATDLDIDAKEVAPLVEEYRTYAPCDVNSNADSRK